MSHGDVMPSFPLRVNRFDLAALVLSLLGIIAAYLVADRVFDRVPHLEDEIAYVWQAEAMAGGALTTPSPVLPHKFLIPFVVDHDGMRFGKYPLGWPAALSVGVRLGLRDWVNPLLAGIAVWLTYLLGKKLLGQIAGLIAAALTLTSPFFLMNTGSLLSHPLGLVLSLALALVFWDVIDPPKDRKLPPWLPQVTAGLTVGLFGITRPYTAIAVVLPFALLGLLWFVRGDAARRKRLAVVGVFGVAVGLLHFAWQAVATGDPLMNPYEFWWPYDRIGFGPGHGVLETGHTLHQAWRNMVLGVFIGRYDLFGWAGHSWLLLPFGLWAVRRNGRMLWTSSIVVSLLVVYMAYWIGAWTLGPRYQFEGLYSLTLLSAAGFCWLAGLPVSPAEPYASGTGRLRVRRLAAAAAASLLVMASLAFYLPPRLGALTDLYGISRDSLVPFHEAEDELAPALIVVHTGHWTRYGALLELEDPFLTTPFIFVWGDEPGMLEKLIAAYPDRAIYHYDPDDPWAFYTNWYEE